MGNISSNNRRLLAQAASGPQVRTGHGQRTTATGDGS